MALPDEQLTVALLSKVRQLYPEEQWAAVAAMLESECGRTLPLIGRSADDIERVRCAALKLGEGSVEKLRAAVLAAQTDWRDVLVAAGFGSRVAAHKEWLGEDQTSSRGK